MSVVSFFVLPKVKNGQKLMSTILTPESFSSEREYREYLGMSNLTL